MIWFAVFDWEHSKEKLLSEPMMYRIGLDDVYFSRSEFWRWFVYACWQGILLVIIIFVTMDSAQEQNGQIGGLTNDGNFMFCALVIIVNVKILISSFEHSFWSLFFIFGSILSFFLVFDIMDHMMVTGAYGEFWHEYNQIQVYNLLLFFTFSYVLIDNGMQMLNSEIRYYMRIRRQQIEKEKKRKIAKDETLDQDRYVNFERKLNLLIIIF